METDKFWKELTPDNLPTKGTWILISDGTGWRRVFVTDQYDFAEHPDDVLVYNRGITHWRDIPLPLKSTNTKEDE
jgi:hypothetical protein